MTLRCLLTGGSGMVGRNILEHPKADEWEILAPCSGELDLTQSTQVYDYIQKNKPDVVVHAAALVGGIHANIENPVTYLDINLVMGRNVIMAAYQLGVKRLLNIASTCMYPRGAQNPLHEEMILSGELEPTNEGYALAKIVTTRLCQYIKQRDTSMAYKSLIPCNLYGRYDKYGTQNSHLVAAIIHKIHRAMVKGEKTVEIWGDGSVRREFMYAGDLADAVLRAINEIDTLPNVMNIALGYDFSVNDYYKIIAQTIGWNGDFVHSLSKPVGMLQKLASVKLQEQWGWQPQTALSDGIEKAYSFYCNEHSANR